ncbi:MAG: bifunctional heptose 7-phosphate kinase/heptose 1-phosphate adenyltransferase [Planctomycetota bacterium]
MDTEATARQALADQAYTMAGCRVVVVGDVMLDHYVWGEAERISPEAPVPVLRVTRETELPGGAANVARNIVALGGEALLFGLVGDDERGRHLEALCRCAGIRAHFVSDSRPTTTKVRYIAHNQQLLRADWEHPHPLEAAAEARMADALRKVLTPGCVVVVSDYAKGAFTAATADVLRAAEARVVVDPRPSQKTLYKGFHLMTPNHREAAAIAGTDHTAHPPDDAAAAIAEGWTPNVLVTCGGEGMVLYTGAGERESIPARARQVYDVTGAGDTVAATVALALAADLDLSTAAHLANHAAAVAVGRIGAAAVSLANLREDLLTP